MHRRRRTRRAAPRIRRIPPEAWARLIGPTCQNRVPVTLVRRGPLRRAMLRMLTCKTCGGEGSYTVDGLPLRITCTECNGGFTRELEQ